MSDVTNRQTDTTTCKCGGVMLPSRNGLSVVCAKCGRGHANITEIKTVAQLPQAVRAELSPGKIAIALADAGVTVYHIVPDGDIPGYQRYYLRGSDLAAAVAVLKQAKP